MKKPLRTILLVAVGCVAIAGAWLACSAVLPLMLAFTGTSGLPCTPPPKDFSEASLIGTWVAGAPDQREILEIREDGTYRQTIHIEFAELPPVDYESDWQPWRLEARDNGIPYLHLEGMRLCAFNPELSCDQVGGGGHDFCRNAQVLMDNEGILLVLGAPKPLIGLPGDTYAARGIILWFPAGSENTWNYNFSGP